MTTINPWKPETDIVLHQALGKLAEECNELAKIATRCVIQGYAEADPVTEKLNRTQLMEEVADVKATMRWLFDVLDIPFNGESQREARKFDGFKRWEAMLRADTGDTSPALAAQMRDLAGWKLAPLEPTREMCEAAPSLPGIHAVDDLPLNKAGWSMKAIQNLKRYRAMLAAAPKKQDGDG